jgi:hypothetical protein
MPTRSAGMWRSPITDGLRIIWPISLVPKKRAQRCGQLTEEVRKAPCSFACAPMLKKSAESFFDFEGCLRMPSGCFPDHLRIIRTGMRLNLLGRRAAAPEGRGGPAVDHRRPAPAGHPRPGGSPLGGRTGQGAGDVSEANELRGGRGPTAKTRAKPAD